MTAKKVVLVHGWGGSFQSTWKAPGVTDIIADLGLEARGVDLLGHGSAEKPHDPAAYADLAGYLAERLPSEPHIAVGFSLGALTLLRVVAAQPERFLGVCLAGIGNGVFEAPKPEDAERILAGLEGRADPDDNIARLFAQYAASSENDPQALAAVLRRPPAERMTREKCSSFERPVLVAIGEKDFAAPAEGLASAFPHSELAVLPRTDHFATPNSFEFIDALVRWLERHFAG
jgi:pimeloyl-ACP methyl ester carboxylesterase